MLEFIDDNLMLIWIAGMLLLIGEVGWKRNRSQ
jgi:hypothetical protein